MAKINLADYKQSFIGSFVAIIIFFAIRGNNPFFFNPIRGLVITIVLMWIYYNGFRQKNKKEHFILNVSVAFVVCAFVAQTFGLITTAEIFSFKVFGSLVIIGLWIAFASAWLYDRYNITNPMQRNYIRGR